MKKKNTLVGRDCIKVPGFAQMYEKLKQQVTLNGYPASTLNYGRWVCFAKPN